MAQGTSASLSESQEMGELQFLLCESCHGEVRSPKLLPCLHNLCTQCLEETQPTGHCAICRAPYPPELQCNMFFANLQSQLSIYQRISQSQGLACSCSSEREAVFWCSECDWLFCDGVCSKNHDRVKKNSPHEVKTLKNLQDVSSAEFLAGTRKQSAMNCPKINHNNDTARFYCNECRRPMCVVCVTLDSKHQSQHCEMPDEIRRRQNELQNMQSELKKSNHSEVYHSLQELVGSMEKARNETRELIQQQIGEMVKVLQEKEAKFLEEVEAQHQQQVKDVERRLKDVEGLVKRVASSEQLVEKMQLYASDQVVLEMHPHIKKSLEELRDNQPPVVNFQIQARDFAEVKTQLQALYERVTKARAVPGGLDTAPNQGGSEKQPSRRRLNEVARMTDASDSDGTSTSTSTSNASSSNRGHLPKSPAKRKCGRLERAVQTHLERAVQTPTKVVKMEHDYDGAGSSQLPSNRRLEETRTSSQSPGCAHPTGSRDRAGEGMGSSKWSPRSDPQLSEPDDAPVSISSGDEITDDESVESSLLQDIRNRSQSSQEERLRQEFQPGQGTMVFFDLKLLPGDILHLVALAEETNCCSVLIQPLVPSSGGDARSKLSETGLENFLDYVCSLSLPILVGYNIWSVDHLPALVDALQALNKEDLFEASIFGFIDALPLIKEKTPELNSHTLKSLDSAYLWGQLNDTWAYDCARTLKDLCTVLEVNPVMEKRPIIAYSNLRSYASLRPLLWQKLLSEPSAKTLALHGVCLSMLQHVYQEDPERGLSKLCRFLNRSRKDTEDKIQKLSKIRFYFQKLQSAAWHLPPAATS
ncbi:protein PML-like isoform X2 [Zootoca vivipara]|uniref:protein PML-like isoform X2 n=1 Tax=Zootoca vivipara TaxID=8524 RepID=UPI00293BCA61|nr:protein PML-like isoform X2 [Zootoca vivipara]